MQMTARAVQDDRVDTVPPADASGATNRALLEGGPVEPIRPRGKPRSEQMALRRLKSQLSLLNAEFT